MPIQVIEQGPRNYIAKVIGPEVGTVISVAGMTPPCAEVRIMKLTYDFINNLALGAGFVAWEATVNVDAVSLNGHSETMCFEEFGGIPNNAGAGKTGNVIVDVPDGGTMVLYLKKVRPVIPL